MGIPYIHSTHIAPAPGLIPKRRGVAPSANQHDSYCPLDDSSTALPLPLAPPLLLLTMASRTPLLALRAARAVRAPVRSLAVSARRLQEPSAAPFKEPVGVNPAEAVAGAQTALHEYGQYILTSLPRYVQQFSVYKDELTLYIPPQAVIPVFTFLRDHTQCQYRQVVDITAVDFPTKPSRFEVCAVFLIPPCADPSQVVYHLLSHAHQSRIRVKTYADEVTAVPSIVGLFNGANWYEREVWDMYGIFFEGHPDLYVSFFLQRQRLSQQATYLDRLWIRGLPSAERLSPYRASILTYGYQTLISLQHRATQRSDTMTKRSESSMNPFNSPRRLETLTMPLRLGSKSVVVIPRSGLKSIRFPRPQSPRRRRKSRLEQWGFHASVLSARCGVYG